MSSIRLFWCGIILILAALSFPSISFADVSIGEAARGPKEVSLPAAKPGVPSPDDLTVTVGFNVNTDTREQVREFYNGIYGTSDNVAMDSTADVPNCNPGENSEAFLQAVLRRINWFRAMAGVPASVRLDAADDSWAQQMALFISANNSFNHYSPSSLTCYTDLGHQFAGGNQAEGANGPGAITDYIWDFGSGNNEVGHRRWILMPSTLVMGTGDVPESIADGVTNAAANSTWVFDASIYDPRPATRQPYVSWPPEGFVPYQVVFPYWSFALSNADVSAGQVTMTSNGVPVAVSVQPVQNGYGENTLVWVPMGLDASCECTSFPFNGTDTVYGVTVSNINIGTGGATNLVSFSYSVTVFDPATPGGDYVAPVVNGPAQPLAGVANVYNATPINNPNVTSYEWLTSRLTSGDVVEDANVGLEDFTFSPAPSDYSIVTNAPDGSTNLCFHLCHDGPLNNPQSQFLTLNGLLLPRANTSVSFESILTYASPDETARVQASTDGGATWEDLYVQAGLPDNEQPVESVFTLRTVSLAGQAGLPTRLRFNYAYTGGEYWPYSDPGTGGIWNKSS